MLGWAVGRLGGLGVGLGGWVGRLGGWVVWVLGWAVGRLGVGLGVVFGVLCCENMERHREAKAHDNEERSGEMGTDFGASKTLWPSG